MHWNIVLIESCMYKSVLGKINKLQKKTQHFSVISWQEQANFQWNHDEVCFVLNQHTYLILNVLDCWKNIPRVDMPSHTDTVSWFRANQTLLVLLSATSLAEKQQIPILWSLVWPDQCSNPRSAELVASILTTKPPVQFIHSIIYMWIILFVDAQLYIIYVIIHMIYILICIILVHVQYYK